MWLYKGKNYNEIHDSKLVGFVYLLTYIPTGQKYIGKKNFYSKRKVAKTKKELALITDKRVSKKKVVVKESNWKTYKSSNDFLKDKQEKDLKKDILYFCSTETELTYQEVKHQFLFGVLETGSWLNRNILGKFFNAK